MGLGGKVAVIGSGVVELGENVDQNLTDMIHEAVTFAPADAGIERDRLQTAGLGCHDPKLQPAPR